MSADGKDVVRPDTGFYSENRRKFPSEQLIPYAGQTLAWTADGTRIVAHGKDFLTLWNQLKAAGRNPSELVFEDLPIPGDDTWL